MLFKYMERKIIVLPTVWKVDRYLHCFLLQSAEMWQLWTSSAPSIDIDKLSPMLLQLGCLKIFQTHKGCQSETPHNFMTWVLWTTRLPEAIDIMLKFFSHNELAGFLAEMLKRGTELQGIKTNLGHNKSSLSAFLVCVPYLHPSCLIRLNVRNSYMGKTRLFFLHTLQGSCSREPWHTLSLVSWPSSVVNNHPNMCVMILDCSVIHLNEESCHSYTMWALSISEAVGSLLSMSVSNEPYICLSVWSMLVSVSGNISVNLVLCTCCFSLA